MTYASGYISSRARERKHGYTSERRPCCGGALSQSSGSVAERVHKAHGLAQKYMVQEGQCLLAVRVASRDALHSDTRMHFVASMSEKYSIADMTPEEGQLTAG